MISGAAFAGALERRGFDFFAGVPCSLIEDLIATLESHPRLPYVATPREDVAVGMAAGAWFGGRRPVVLMQNSGLGTSLNALASLSLMYGLPALLVVTWRGHGGQDAPEHVLMGEISPRLLDLLGIPHRVLSADTLEADLDWAAAEMNRLMQPVALLVPPKVVEVGQAHAATSRARVARAPLAAALPETLKPSLSRLAALAAARKPLGHEPVVHANGYICRESFSLGDRPENFYMIGSMGLASAIGLGVALARPDRPAVVFDGDGNLLMNLGILPMIGGGPLMSGGRPANFVHVVFDNAVYGSTGNQASPSRHARLDAIAAASGYRSAVAVAEGPAVREAVAAALRDGGPAFVLVKVTAEEQPAPRIPYPPEEIRDRFRGALAGAARARR
jgi:phosphonopyruvate decarboxylase